MLYHINRTEKGENIFMAQINYDPVNISKIKCCNNNDDIIAKSQNRTELSLHGGCTIIGILYLFFFFLWRALQHPYDIVLT